MVLRLDPAVPLVWRTPHSLQFGVESDPVVLEHLTRDDELLVAALRRGVTRAGLDAIAAERGIPGSAVDALLARFGATLTTEATARSGALVLGSGSLAESLAGVLRDAGHRPDAGPLGLVVLVGAWLITPAESGHWLRRDIPHLPLVVADGVVTVGPLVRPGHGPCLHCVDRHRIDADPSWPAVAAQLLDQPAPRLGALGSAAALALAGRVALGALGPHGWERIGVGTAWRVDLRDGTVSERVWPPHPDCRCSAPQGSDWANADERRATRRRALRLVATTTAPTAPALG